MYAFNGKLFSISGIINDRTRIAANEMNFAPQMFIKNVYTKEQICFPCERLDFDVEAPFIVVHESLLDYRKTITYFRQNPYLFISKPLLTLGKILTGFWQNHYLFF
jgi:hypothetical protein